MDHENIESALCERFLRYVKIATPSDLRSKTLPSTAAQKDLALLLAEELRELGVREVECTASACVVARLPGNTAAKPLALFAHIDTSADVSAVHIQPQVHRSYDGGTLALNDTTVLDPAEHPLLKAYQGQTIITTDGNSLLGADDKAGIAEIMTVVDYLMQHPDLRRGDVFVVFNPDEEIGMGTRAIPELPVTYGLTLDGQQEGEIEYECFNASMARLSFLGKSTHTGVGKNRLINAITMTQRFLSLLPQAESPEATDGRDGFFAPIHVEGKLEKTTVSLLIRDFSAEGLAEREGRVQALAEAACQSSAGGRVEVEIIPQYKNMRPLLDKHPRFCQLLVEALRSVGVDPRVEIIRGGTDGALLAERGIAAPNLFTGAMAIHSCYEWVALPAMGKAVEAVIAFLLLWAENPRSL